LGVEPSTASAPTSSPAMIELIVTLVLPKTTASSPALSVPVAEAAPPLSATIVPVVGVPASAVAALVSETSCLALTRMLPPADLSVPVLVIAPLDERSDMPDPAIVSTPKVTAPVAPGVAPNTIAEVSAPVPVTVASGSVRLPALRIDTSSPALALVAANVVPAFA
jgi:hypothetical protein